MTKWRTTICCSAFALTLLSAATSLVAQSTTTAPARIAFKTAWTVPLNGSLSAPPVYSGARGFFPLDQGRLVAYDISLGADVWTVQREVHSQPAAGAGLLFIAEEGAIAALHDSDGSVLWRVAFDDLLAVPLVFDNGWLIAVSSAGSVFAFRASDGGMVWRSEVGVPANARPALAADRVYIPTNDRRIVALHVESGMPLWERRIGGPPNDVLALDDRLYVGSDDNYLYCLKAGDGIVDWRWPTGADVIGRPVTDDRLVYFVSLDNLLRALDRKSGNQRWKRPLPLRPTTGPLKAGDRLIVSGVAPTLRAYFAKDGTPAGEVSTEGELAAPPYVFDDPDAAAVIVVTRNIAKGGVILSALSLAPPPPPPPPPPAAAPSTTPNPQTPASPAPSPPVTTPPRT